MATSYITLIFAMELELLSSTPSHCILLPLVFVEGLGSQSGENLGMSAMLLKTNGDRVLEVASMLAWLGRWRDYLGGFNTGDLQPRAD